VVDAYNNGIYEIINDHGTSLLGHYACPWNQDGVSVNGPIWSLVIVHKCQRSRGGSACRDRGRPCSRGR